MLYFWNINNPPTSHTLSIKRHPLVRSTLLRYQPVAPSRRSHSPFAYYHVVADVFSTPWCPTSAPAQSDRARPSCCSPRPSFDGLCRRVCQRLQASLYINKHDVRDNHVSSTDVPIPGLHPLCGHLPVVRMLLDSPAKWSTSPSPNRWKSHVSWPVQSTAQNTCTPDL